ncbi:MAG: class I SAM-dependent methyltransferase [Candidatus Berkelbacteria bacterium]|nr:class I SAM-dependent methyltransferase [Candidatus Berkelbacteria bacterium]
MSESWDIDKIDSLFIAKHILEDLGTNWGELAEKQAQVPLDPKVLETVHSIETIEETWEYKAISNEHTFGRKEKDETIRLWSVPRKSAEVLRNLVILTQSTSILEIGTSAGYSTLFLADGAKQNNGQVVTIELLSDKAKLARNFFRDSELNNVRLLETEANEALTNWDSGKVDFVFLDADKENYGKYLDLLLPLMKTGAIIVADNVNDYGHLMEDYLQKVNGTHLPQSRADKRVRSYYLAALDNGLIITTKL